jgi:hypothetical protein
MSVHVAWEVGASSGRVMLGSVGRDHLQLSECARFRNGPGRGRFRHHFLLGCPGSVAGRRGRAPGGRHVAAAAGEEVATVGVDTWAIDYGLLDAGGALLGNPRSYRDARTEGGAEQLHGPIAPRPGTPGTRDGVGERPRPGSGDRDTRQPVGGPAGPLAPADPLSTYTPGG